VSELRRAFNRDAQARPGAATGTKAGGQSRGSDVVRHVQACLGFAFVSGRPAAGIQHHDIRRHLEPRPSPVSLPDSGGRGLLALENENGVRGAGAAARGLLQFLESSCQNGVAAGGSEGGRGRQFRVERVPERGSQPSKHNCIERSQPRGQKFSPIFENSLQILAQDQAGIPLADA